MDAKEQFEKFMKNFQITKTSLDNKVSNTIELTNFNRKNMLDCFEAGYHSRDKEVKTLKYKLECHQEAINVLPAIYKNRELKELLKKAKEHLVCSKCKNGADEVPDCEVCYKIDEVLNGR